MTDALPNASLRPMLPDDVPVLAAILEASVEQLTGDDYSEAQQAAWITVADDEPAFAAQLRDALTLVGTRDGAPVGFASLKGTDRIDMIYVHPDAAGQGIGSMLCDALERLAAARGAASLVTDASDNAQVFFAKRGFVPTQRNTRAVNGEWLANTTMRKELKGGAP